MFPTLRIVGEVFEERVARERILQYAKDQRLLCHIDYKPCIDAAWIEEMKKSGQAEQIIEEMTQKLTNQMTATEKDYVSIVKVVARECSRL